MKLPVGGSEEKTSTLMPLRGKFDSESLNDYVLCFMSLLKRKKIKGHTKGKVISTGHSPSISMDRISCRESDVMSRLNRSVSIH